MQRDCTGHILQRFARLSAGPSRNEGLSRGARSFTSTANCPGSPGLDYAASRGIPDEAPARYRMGFDSASARHCREALVLPWLDADGAVQGIKYRFIDAGDPRYVLHPGSSCLLYGADVLPASHPAFVCVEGEINALSIAAALPEAAVVSIGSKGNRSGIAAAAALHRAKCEAVPVLVWLDEERDATAAWRAFEVESVYAFRSPEGRDANALLVQYGGDTLRQLLIRRLDIAHRI